jgi:hypothetical protein
MVPRMPHVGRRTRRRGGRVRWTSTHAQRPTARSDSAASGSSSPARCSALSASKTSPPSTRPQARASTPSMHKRKHAVRGPRLRDDRPRRRWIQRSTRAHGQRLTGAFRRARPTPRLPTRTQARDRPRLGPRRDPGMAGRQARAPQTRDARRPAVLPHDRIRHARRGRRRDPPLDRPTLATRSTSRAPPIGQRHRSHTGPVNPIATPSDHEGT